MRPGEETPNIIDECRRADAEIEKYCKARSLITPYCAPWPGSAISCGRSPLPLVILSLIEDNKRLREDMEALERVRV